MKLFIKLMIFILVLGLTGPFLMKKPDGRPWMTVDDLFPSLGGISIRARALWSRVSGRLENLGEEPSGSTRIYKWRDSEGNWQFSDQPNPQGDSETILVDPNANVIQSTPLPAPEPEKESEVTAQGGQIGVTLPMTVPPGQVSKLMQDAQQVQDLMNQRNQALEALSGGQPAGQ